METKKYGIYGVIERFLSVRLGKGVVTFSFMGGLVDSAGVRPAVFITSSLYDQTVIESLPEYKNGTIKLLSSYGQPETTNKEYIEITEVANVQQARAYFLEKGYEMRELSNKKDILAVASKEGVVFPNWVQ